MEALMDCIFWIKSENQRQMLDLREVSYMELESGQIIFYLYGGKEVTFKYSSMSDADAEYRRFTGIINKIEYLE